MTNEEILITKFNHLQPIRKTTKTRSDGTKRSAWLCLCDCGNEKIAEAHELLKNRLKSCGCLKNVKPRKNNFSTLLTREFFYENYYRLGKSFTKLSKEFSIPKTAIEYYFGKYGFRRTEREKAKYPDDITTVLRRGGYGEITMTILYKIIARAKVANREFTVSAEFLWELFLKQNKKCALSGVDLKFAKAANAIEKKNQTASLDRIDSSKGYTEDNVQWVHKEINVMKMDHSDEEFVEWCKKVVKHQKKVKV